MEPERWREIERIYHEALEQDASRRAVWVKQAARGDDALEQEVRSLLEHADDEGAFLEQPALEVAGRDLAMSAAAPSRPATIGRYRILRLLGEGGMGAVYEAEQEEPRRVVALKVIRLGLATPERLRRFRQESQALARLQHPGIAQIYESGTADTGFGPHPYLAMELIRGLPLDEYAGVHRLDARQKLAMIVKICDAAGHAHQRGLIHRDLKPGNILVDEMGQPKILDFGVARVTEAAGHDGGLRPTMETGLGQLVGTLAYMSPEQVMGDPAGVDARSDVYSLGVILYEMLAGRLPYEISRDRIPEAVKTIQEEDPAPLSTIERTYRGDVDTIVRKALEKDKTRRYGSAADLAADILRYLHDQPIAARPPSASYQIAKFTRRHRGLTAAAAAVFSVLIAGIAVSTSQAIRASRAEQEARRDRDRAQRRFNEVRRLAHSVIFDLQDKIAALPGSTPVRKELIANVIGYVDSLAKEAAGDPGLQQELAEAYLQIGDIQGGGNENLGDRQGALGSFQKAEQIARALVAAQPSFAARKLLVETLRDVGQVYGNTDDRAKAEAYRKETLAMVRDFQKQYPGNEDVESLMANSLFDIAALTRDSQTLGYRLEAMPIFEKLLSAKPSDPRRQRNAALIHKFIAGYWLDLHDYDRALPSLQRALALDEARLTNDPGDQGAKLDLSFDYSQFGEYYGGRHDMHTAIEYQRKTLTIRRDLAASDPKDVWKQGRLAWTLTSAAGLLIETHDYRAALAYLDESGRISERLGMSDRGTMDGYAFTLKSTGEANRAIGNEQAACQQFSRASDLYRKLGYSPSSSMGPTLAELEKDLATCAR